MALQSEVSPPIIGDPNKDIKIDGDTKSDENDTSQSSDEDDVDLEEGEILDSGAEEQEEKDFTNSSLKDALDKNCLQNIEQLINQSKNADGANGPNHEKIASPRKMNKRQGSYMDHDREEATPEQNEGWFSRSPKQKKTESRPIDYRNELEAYRGPSPPSSPERKKRDEKKRKKSSKKSKKSSRRAITRKDAKGQRVMRYKENAARGKPCKYFKEGNCAKGSSCSFSHSLPEQKFRKKELCKFYLSGHCNKGESCIYMHNDFPCKFYHTGSVCFAKKDCRFSHDPLTDEMKKVLADYLRHVHGDRDRREDDFHHREDEEDREREQENRGRERERKRHLSRSPEHSPQGPPLPKRVCLLGSPPRRIRESEETKRWQEEMKVLQHQHHPSFEISLMQHEDGMSPTHFPKPNFYQETLLNSSPQHQHPVQFDGPLGPPPCFNQPIFPPRNFNEESPQDGFPYEEFQEVDEPPIKQEQMDDDYGWNDSRNIIEPNPSQPSRNLGFNDNSHQDLDFTSDVKFDETTQFSEMESSTDGHPMLSPSSAALTSGSKKEGEGDNSNPEIGKVPEKESSDSGAVNVNQETPAQPIVIPSHLPRKQRELFMRVQQHNQQKVNVENTDSPVKRESEDEEEKTEHKSEESKWYSSEDDDDDSDELLTDVLKKIQQGPPLPKPVEPKPAVNLMEMLNKIQQNTMEKSKIATGSQQPNLLGPFLKNILGSVPAPTPAASSPVPAIIPDVKRRTLLPDPVVPTLPLPDAFSPNETAVPKEAPKDPRLKNRDPRTLSNTPANATKQTPADRTNVGNNSPTVDFNSLGQKPLSNIVNDPLKDNMPYRLHGIYTKPPNYIPYINASHTNPNLLNDPRLRKHLQPPQRVETPMGNGKEPEIIKPPPPKDVPPIPELLLKYEKPGSFINIFESNSSTKSSGTVPDSRHPLPMAAQRVCDPRTIRRDSRSNSGSDTPPHLTIVDTSKSPPQQEFKTAPVLENALMEPMSEKKNSPPVLEKNWTPPLLDKPWSPDAVKKETDSDSESNPEPPNLDYKLEKHWSPLVIKQDPEDEPNKPESTLEKPWSAAVTNNEPESMKTIEPPSLERSGKVSFRKSLSPEREFIAIKKESPPHDSDAPPVVPPLIIKKIKPTPASHLPRAIADPRMAKLHNHLDPRRLRSSDKGLVERKKQPTKPAASNVTEGCSNSPDASKSPSGETETVEKEAKPKAAKSIPKKRRLSDKGEEKKRTVHRNRKSSMDYASPLNSCDDAVPVKSSSYNSYNQRPKRSTNHLSDKIIIPNLSSTETSDTSSIPNFLMSDSSSIDCDNSSDGNLKDKFKTIDPTASPFC